MLDQETTAYVEWLRLDAIQQAFVRSVPGSRTSAAPRPPRKNPAEMARANFNLVDHDHQARESAAIARRVGEYWKERASVTLLRLSSRELDQLTQALGTLEFRQNLALMACIADPDCDEDALRTSHRESRSAEIATMLGPEEFAHFSRANGVDSEAYYQVRHFRDELPDEHQLTDGKARRLAEAIAANASDGENAGGRDQAVARLKRLHDVAGRILSREQLRLFDAMLEKNPGSGL